MELIRTLGCERAEVRGERFRAIHNDCVLEMQTMEANSIDFVCTSIPFGNQYEYSPSFNDFGHNTGDGPFFEQMGHMVPEVLRVLKPGRIAAIHVKDRIMFGNVTGYASPTVNPFSDKTTAAFIKAGFVLMARITIDTDVVRENSQTYRLGWSENAKDSSKMGAGMPEYVLVFRKLPSDLSNAYADEPVTKSKAEYTRADWQLDAAGLWRSNGNRLPDPEIMRNMPLEDIKRLWIRYSVAGGYSHEDHVRIAKALEELGKLPSSFMLFPAISRNKDIWTDISRMLTLNNKQSMDGKEKHVCPLQLDIIRRLITRYSNKGDVVLDPFAGIGSVPYMALKMGRKAIGTELNQEYWKDSVGYCEMAEAEVEAPTLFDLMKPTAETAASTSEAA
jgi:DNA modification methylase